MRFFEDNVLVSSDSDLESPFEVIFEKHLLLDPFFVSLILDIFETCFLNHFGSDFDDF